MRKLQERFGDRVTFVMVYVRESNPRTPTFPDIERPRTYPERVCLAERLEDEFYPGFAILVDDLDNRIYQAYGEPRTATFVIDEEGTVRYKAAWAPPRQVGEAVASLFGEEGAPRQATAPAADAELAKATLDIEGMVCQGCVIAVRNGLLAAEGVRSAEVDLVREEARVTYASELIDLEGLKGAVEDTGFGAGDSKRGHP